MSSIALLLSVASAYGDALGIPPTTVSSRVFRDGSKLTALINGADIQTRRYEQALQWFSDNWPAATPWPEGIQRPDQRVAA